ncbi:GGDEF domain-containing protein [Rhizobium sp. SL86]|uniref:GGDEF domain-containing protein n=1 Tax=Rhizobium sp. SL86 TaxID=2995148 RepID=UPI0022729ADC|nr:GGDEF domain-containing protein [Rhizobium sp. SL86]MCY1668579.1 GGDEF domain-containing protein [Rhizobium sp. SL86]
MIARISTDRRPAVDKEAPIRAELVDLLYASTFNVVFIGFAAAFFCSLIARSAGDPVFGAFTVLALLIAGIRFAIDRAYRRYRQSHSTQFWERAHSAGSLMFSVLVGAIGAYTFWRASGEAQLFSAVFLVSYCTGIVTRLAVRPKLAIACVKIAALPYIIILLMHPLFLYQMLALFLLLMSLASLQLIRTSYRLTFDVLITRAELAALAGSDPLTGLANRFTVDQQLQRLFLSQQVGPGHAVAVHFIDLDHFKAANDTYGHAVGDAILVEVAQRLNELLPSDGIAARRGGDEFLVIQPNLAASLDAVRLAKRITASLSQPYTIMDVEVTIGASVGVAATDNTQETPQRLIVAADHALYEAKRKGRGIVEFSDVAIDQVA